MEKVWEPGMECKLVIPLWYWVMTGGTKWRDLQWGLQWGLRGIDLFKNDSLIRIETKMVKVMFLLDLTNSISCACIISIAVQYSGQNVCEGISSQYQTGTLL